MSATPLPTLQQMTDILDLKDIAAWDLRWIWVLAASLLLIFLLLALRSWWKRPRRKNGAAAKPLTPKEAALQKLDDLVNSRLIESGQVRRFYFGLSDLFREFIEAELKIPATEATLEELRPKCRAAPELSPEQSQQAVQLLELADLAKFAQVVPPRDEIVRSIRLCRSWITEVAEARRQAEAERLAAAKAEA